MIEHVTEWLGPYHDSELHGTRLIQVEQHLAECAECRKQLAEIQRLSALLHETESAIDFSPAERFAANLNLKLPRQPERPGSRRMLEIGWWLVPVGLLSVWVLLQVTFSLSSFATVASNSGLLGGNFSWLQGHPLQMEWFSDAMVLFGNQIGSSGRSVLSALNVADVFATEWTSGFLWQLLLAVGYLVWLLSLWLRQPGQSVQKPGSLSSS